jgi:hypothetical protein
MAITDSVKWQGEAQQDKSYNRHTAQQTYLSQLSDKNFNGTEKRRRSPVKRKAQSDRLV